RWNTLDESLREYVILYSETPDPSMTEQLLSDEIPVIVTADDASDVAGYMVAARQLDCHTAIRLTSQCFSTIGETSGKAVLLLRHDQYAARAEAFIKKLADFLRLFLDEDEIGEVVWRLTENTDASVGQALLQSVPHACLPGAYKIQDPGACA